MPFSSTPSFSVWLVLSFPYPTALSEATPVLASIYWCQVGAQNTVCSAKVSHLPMPITHSFTTIFCLETICLVYIIYYRKLWFPNSSMYLIFWQLLSPSAFSAGFSEMQPLNIPFSVCFNRNLSLLRLLPLEPFQMSHIIGLGGKVSFFFCFSLTVPDHSLSLRIFPLSLSLRIFPFPFSW